MLESRAIKDLDKEHTVWKVIRVEEELIFQKILKFSSVSSVAAVQFGYDSD